MQLETNHLILRDFIGEDYHRVLEYRSDSRYLRYYPDKLSAREDALGFIDLVMGWAAELPRQRFQLAMVRRVDGVVIGNCGVRITSQSNREAEFGCELDPRDWRQGYATEAGRAIINYAFGTLGIHRVWARTIAENHSAAMLAERLGMQLEGCLRESIFMRDRWWDQQLYGILEQERR